MHTVSKEISFESWYELGSAWCRLGGDLRTLQSVIERREDARQAMLGFFDALDTSRVRPVGHPRFRA